MEAATYDIDIVDALNLILGNQTPDGGYISDFMGSASLERTDLQTQAYVLMLLADVYGSGASYAAIVTDDNLTTGKNWVLPNQIWNGAYPFAPAWGLDTVHPQVVAEVMGALSQVGMTLNI